MYLQKHLLGTCLNNQLLLNSFQGIDSSFFIMSMNLWLIMGHVLHINNNVAYNDESIVIQIGKQKTETGDSQQAGKQGNVKVKNKCF